MSDAGRKPSPVLTNAQIADRLVSLAQLLSMNQENSFKVRAYRRAAAKIRALPESLHELVHQGEDLTRFGGVGPGIASAIREIIQTGSLKKLETLRANTSPELAAINDYPRLDPKQVMRAYKKLGIGTIDELRQKLESGEIHRLLGSRMAQHIQQGLTEAHAMLLYHADGLRGSIERFLVAACGAQRVEMAGECRRRVEVVGELAFLVEVLDFAGLITRLRRFGGDTPLIASDEREAQFALAAGPQLRIHLANSENWGVQLIAGTGSRAHLKKLETVTGPLDGQRANIRTEAVFYASHGLQYIEPELREGLDEIELAAQNQLPVLVTAADVRGELHAHTVASDGADSIEEMARAARDRGYEYIGITDHSQSLKIARGVSAQDLRQQIRLIDKLNERLRDIRILKSAEVDILADGTLDYPDELLRELDYTICSIHSRFGLGPDQQTERILRAMDNRFFNILGHATGRLLLKRPGYEIDLQRVVDHAKQSGCFLEINSSPDRLDLSAEHARCAAAAGVKIAINTDAHSTGELDLIRCGLDQGRRAGLDKAAVLNCLSWDRLEHYFRR